MAMNEKEIELRKLGFKYNPHQEHYTLYVNGLVYYVDKWDLEDTNIESLKKNIEKDKKWRESSDEFKEGKISAEKGFKKKLTDEHNKYNSWLKEAKNQKLDKIVNEFKVVALESKVELIKKLLYWWSEEKAKQKEVLIDIMKSDEESGIY